MTNVAPAPRLRSPYLSGNYAPIATELDATRLHVTHGELPRDLAGVFVRTGSNPRFEAQGRYHWFDGDGMLHAVHIENGQATYRNRWVRTKAFLAEEAAGKSLWTGVTERPDFGKEGGPFKDSANTDVVFHAGRLLALWWLGGEPYIVKAPSLETCGVETFGGKLRTMSAHPKVDPVTGEMMFFDYKPFPPYLTYGVISGDGTLAHTTPIDLPGPRLQHDMAITERFSILLDMSMMWDPELLAKGRAKTIFAREKPTRFGVIPRHGSGGEIRWFEASACFMYHTINAWEEGEAIVIVGCRIGDPLANENGDSVPTIGFLRLEPHLYKWRIDLVTGKVTEETIDDRLTEFPRMNNQRLGRKSRYSYNPRLAPGATLLFDAVVKYDTESGASRDHVYPKGTFGGETVFAPRASAKDEDDGYLLTFVADEASGASELYVIDAKNVDRAPVARLAIPQRVPTGYHTWWIPEHDLHRGDAA